MLANHSLTIFYIGEQLTVRQLSCWWGPGSLMAIGAWASSMEQWLCPCSQPDTDVNLCQFCQWTEVPGWTFTRHSFRQELLPRGNGRGNPRGKTLIRLLFWLES